MDGWKALPSFCLYGGYMKLRNVRKTYHNQNNDVEALKGISLDLNNNGITVILGSSGCGKTTLLNCIASKETYEGIIEDVPMII